MTTRFRLPRRRPDDLTAEERAAQDTPTDRRLCHEPGQVITANSNQEDQCPSPNR